MIKILIADDHMVVRQGLKEIFSQTPDLILAGEARSGKEVLAQVRNTDPDVVLLDVGLPDKNGLDVIKDLKSEFPDLVVLVLSMYPEDRFEKRFLKAGASGYLTKSSDAEQLIAAIRKISRGGKLISANLAEKLAFDLGPDSGKPPHELLSDREYQVMCMIASGISLTKIAKDLCLSINTISTYRTRILEKMKIKNNIQLTHYVLENKLLE
ncbi:LuxR family transcriptional regulator [Candidatus Nitromaritima sp. SCGC AAA799-A02]|nr:LuxR family transcriptional regulator [Candidatus Nitromaritima sp. SCGC AAA799-A02]KMP11829.1 LuxR family transcriptional regulator [Candidatus Nitromaritima sp. SCGC AAA799-C22]